MEMEMHRREQKKVFSITGRGVNVHQEKRVEETTRQGEQNVTYINTSLSRPKVIALITPSIIALVLTIILYGVGFRYYSRLEQDLFIVQEHNSRLEESLSTLEEQNSRLENNLSILQELCKFVLLPQIHSLLPSLFCRPTLCFGFTDCISSSAISLLFFSDRSDSHSLVVSYAVSEFTRRCN